MTPKCLNYFTSPASYVHFCHNAKERLNFCYIFDDRNRTLSLEPRVVSEFANLLKSSFDECPDCSARVGWILCIMMWWFWDRNAYFPPNFEQNIHSERSLCRFCIFLKLESCSSHIWEHQLSLYNPRLYFCVNQCAWSCPDWNFFHITRQAIFVSFSSIFVRLIGQYWPPRSA